MIQRASSCSIGILMLAHLKKKKMDASMAKIRGSPLLPPALFLSSPVVMLIGPFN